ncbi:squalene/phytoene synthase family protein [Phenylobacterium sp.]|uniref:squalene/phytoene synthase family protein n=1 Tax=Phenylobacterium sp. TaxID=1871053 RepID=UPI0025D209F8|nr:squalene/phytoene synthase family protein [Phenylobacterium sp.]MBX3483977.1 squalene/phytoene synthase family protein [Phenylobacterium sp.]
MSDDDLDDLIRRVDPDRWLSSRFIGDAKLRADVIAIYAYDHELARAPKVASNPLLGEIRLTWWREALDEIYEGRPARRHPTAQALAGVVKRHGLERAMLEDMIDARYRELDATPMSEEEALDWARDTGGWAAVLAARILDPDSPAENAALGGCLWMLRGMFETRPDMRIAIGRTASHAMIDARFMSAAAFPAVAHATLVMRPAKSEIGRRLRLTWAVARGRL